jgi:hypothetical protein
VDFRVSFGLQIIGKFEFHCDIEILRKINKIAKIANTFTNYVIATITDYKNKYSTSIFNIEKQVFSFSH